MRNSGILVANDANKDRARAIIANTHRLGITNTIVTNLDGRQFAEVEILKVLLLLFIKIKSSIRLAYGWI